MGTKLKAPLGNEWSSEAEGLQDACLVCTGSFGSMCTHRGLESRAGLGIDDGALRRSLRRLRRCDERSGFGRVHVTAANGFAIRCAQTTRRGWWLRPQNMWEIPVNVVVCFGSLEHFRRRNTAHAYRLISMVGKPLGGTRASCSGRLILRNRSTAVLGTTLFLAVEVPGIRFAGTLRMNSGSRGWRRPSGRGHHA